jgi:hypothetical protein
MQGKRRPREELTYDELASASRGVEERPVLKAAKRRPHASPSAIRYSAYPHLAAAVPEAAVVHAHTCCYLFL